MEKELYMTSRIFLILLAVAFNFAAIVFYVTHTGYSNTLPVLHGCLLSINFISLNNILQNKS